MVSAQEKAFRVIQYAKPSSVTSVQWEFSKRYIKDPPQRKSINAWWPQAVWSQGARLQEEEFLRLPLPEICL
jgi:hypothetical protein